jgi:menaquinol-cytochrome c reductase iron-sulfur subunit
MNRTTFLKWMVKGGGLVAAGIVVIPAIITAFSPLMRRPGGELWRALGPLDGFPVGTMRHSVVEAPRDDWVQSLRARGVYVWRPAPEELVVYSRNCTDLSCPIVWDPGSEAFFCPCHGGIFAKDGKRMAGPPRRPLYRYANRVREGMVEIDLRSLPPMT